MTQFVVVLAEGIAVVKQGGGGGRVRFCRRILSSKFSGGLSEIHKRVENCTVAKKRIGDLLLLLADITIMKTFARWRSDELHVGQWCGGCKHIRLRNIKRS